ncbi:MAG: hypothetical protein Q4G07_02525 [Oscillospiraceae bacterium]|nr:hypothetical protein [Oscillospiraceae bacterium]
MGIQELTFIIVNKFLKKIIVMHRTNPRDTTDRK